MGRTYYRDNRGRYGYESRESRRRRRRRRVLRQRLILFFVILALVLGGLLFFIFGKLASGSSDKEPASQDSTDLSPETEDTEKDTDTEKVSDGRPVVVIDAGHGGKDQGTANGDVKEKDINLNLALCLQEELEEQGIRVIMTRDDDTFLYLRERSDIANKEKADLFLSVHVDAYYDDTSIHGMTCHYGLGAVEGQQMAAVLANSLREEADWKIRDTKESDLFVLNNSNMPGVLLETGFISNSQDLANLTDPDYLKRLAARIAEGLLDYLESTALPSGT